MLTPGCTVSSWSIDLLRLHVACKSSPAGLAPCRVAEAKRPFSVAVQAPAAELAPKARPEFVLDVARIISNFYDLSSIAQGRAGERD